jgi:hypothetical protein
MCSSGSQRHWHCGQIEKSANFALRQRYPQTCFLSPHTKRKNTQPPPSSYVPSLYAARECHRISGKEIKRLLTRHEWVNAVGPCVLSDRSGFAQTNLELGKEATCCCMFTEFDIKPQAHTHLCGGRYSSLSSHAQTLACNAHCASNGKQASKRKQG